MRNLFWGFGLALVILSAGYILQVGQQYVDTARLERVNKFADERRLPHATIADVQMEPNDEVIKQAMIEADEIRHSPILREVLSNNDKEK
jgi:CO dehydrogenase/acetyl-CoA synthase epsilon subunit